MEIARRRQQREAVLQGKLKAMCGLFPSFNLPERRLFICPPIGARSQTSKVHPHLAEVVVLWGLKKCSALKGKITKAFDGKIVNSKINAFCNASKKQCTRRYGHTKQAGMKNLKRKNLRDWKDYEDGEASFYRNDRDRRYSQSLWVSTFSLRKG